MERSHPATLHVLDELLVRAARGFGALELAIGDRLGTAPGGLTWWLGEEEVARSRERERCA